MTSVRDILSEVRHVAMWSARDLVAGALHLHADHAAMLLWMAWTEGKIGGIDDGDEVWLNEADVREWIKEQG